VSITVSTDEYPVANNNNTKLPAELIAERTDKETATFYTDKVEEVKSLQNVIPLSNPEMNSLAEARVHEIRSFLSRPVVLRTNEWAIADPVMTILETVSLPDDILSHPMYSEKTRGFLGFKADIVLRLQVNATPFQQGRLFVCWLPQGQLLGLRGEITHSNLVFCTQMPRIDFDASTDSDVVMRIPYVSPTLMYNQANQLGPFGEFRLMVYSPLMASSGASVADYTIFAHFENVELEFPTFVSQSGPLTNPRGPLRLPPTMTLERRLSLRANVMALCDMLDDRQLIYVYHYFRDLKAVSSNPEWIAQCGDIVSPCPPKKKKRHVLRVHPPEIVDTGVDLTLERRRAIYATIETLLDGWEDSTLERAHDWLAGFVPTCSTLNIARGDLATYARTRNFVTESGKMTRAGSGRGSTSVVPSTSEARAYGVGPISSALSRLSLASNIIGEIPLLSSVAGTVSWASAIMSRAASVFGYSKPRSVDAVSKNHVGVQHYINNTDGVSTAHSMGLYSDARVGVIPGFAGTDNDEMSISYMLSIPTWFRTIPWSQPVTQTTLLFSIPIQLAQFEVNLGTSLAGIVWGPTPVAFLRRYFEYWRGSLCFKFKFVKTAFHSGRLQFSYSPSNVYTPGFTSTDYLYKDIVDIRESNEYTVTIPYAQVLPYLTTSGGTNGFLYCHVLNNLVAPATVSSSIDILAELHAGEDFEFAFPCPPTATAAIYLNRNAPAALMARSAIEVQEVEEEEKDLEAIANDSEFVSQALGENVAEMQHSLQPAKQPESIGSGNPAASGGLAPSLACIGEKILSLKQLLNRSIPIFYDGGRAERSVLVDPYELQLPILWNNRTDAVTMAVDYVSTFSSLFAYKRGGMRLDFYQQRVGSAGTGYSATFRAALVPRSARAPFRTPGFDNLNDVWNVCTDSYPVGAGMSVEVPQYTQTHSTLNRPSSSIDVKPTDAYASNSVVIFRIGRAGTNVTPATYLRAAADDYQLGFYIGTLPQIAGSAVNVSVDW
jgi:hypothetical protein